MKHSHHKKDVISLSMVDNYTPPRIRGLVDRLERAVRMQIYAKREDKRQRKHEVLEAKVAILRAFAVLSQSDKT